MLYCNTLYIVRHSPNIRKIKYQKEYLFQILLFSFSFRKIIPENWTIEDLLNKHSSQPRNPDIATAFFRSGYVESWGRGMDKMKNLCQEAKIPAPQFSCKGNDFWTVFRKDIYNKQDLCKLGLNERQIKAVMYVKENGKITNSEYQEVNGIGKSVSIDELRNLIDKQILVRIGETGRGTYYELPR